MPLMVISLELFYSRVDCRACPISRSRTAHNNQTVMELFPCPGQRGWGRSHSFHTSDHTSPDMAHIINFILNKRGSSHFTERKSIFESNLGFFEVKKQDLSFLSTCDWIKCLPNTKLRSPKNVIPLDCFFWGRVKNLRSIEEIQDINHLRQIKIYLLDVRDVKWLTD